ncbi:hypothetical protein FA95DRAFT_587972 [Auriscalpium vulgare]|uniref:Uncharacterized protein n=1 Tax=Auriscalpium vulgare TaxID=40419 RepID=A0ACB8RF45_9AGAM|nr:hypothetical protein FA95DRAFT_587972 [Auriscalpium vulgare]
MRPPLPIRASIPLHLPRPRPALLPQIHQPEHDLPPHAHRRIPRLPRPREHHPQALARCLYMARRVVEVRVFGPEHAHGRRNVHKGSEGRVDEGEREGFERVEGRGGVRRAVPEVCEDARGEKGYGRLCAQLVSGSVRVRWEVSGLTRRGATIGSLATASKSTNTPMDMRASLDGPAVETSASWIMPMRGSVAHPISPKSTPLSINPRYAGHVSFSPQGTLKRSRMNTLQGVEHGAHKRMRRCSPV